MQIISYQMRYLLRLTGQYVPLVPLPCFDQVSFGLKSKRMQKKKKLHGVPTSFKFQTRTMSASP